MKTLKLTLKKKWFYMILSGDKTEEYREIKDFWNRRLTREHELGGHCALNGIFKNYRLVEFRNGYASDAPTMILECKGIAKGKAKPEWSDGWQGEVFIIKLGEILDTSNCL
jgi:hypothetical protein